MTSEVDKVRRPIWLISLFLKGFERLLAAWGARRSLRRANLQFAQKPSLFQSATYVSALADRQSYTCRGAALNDSSTHAVQRSVARALISCLSLN